MKEDDFSQLVASIKQAGKICRGERKPSLRKTISVPDIQKIRGGTGAESVRSRTGAVFLKEYGEN